MSETLVGSYNLYNIGAAQAVAKILGVEDAVPTVIRNFSGVPGRREELDLGQKFRVMVDFAHTPNALENLLKQLRTELPRGKKLILVFGCAGLRDHTKRSLMGRVALKLADKVIITTEDPRTESLTDIYQDITQGSKNFTREDDRQEAVNQAVQLAKLGDMVVLTGKGHETSMCFGKTEYPWSDKKALETAIRTILQ